MELDVCYKVDKEESSIFENNWLFVDKFEHGAWTQIAKYFKRPEGDGHDVTVECIALPARFFKIVVHPCKNSIGKTKKGWTLKTGSDMGKFAHDIALSVANGMLDIE